MSRQCRRSRVLASKRLRLSIARTIAETKVQEWCERNPGKRPGNRLAVWTRAVHNGELSFDVYRAREHALALVRGYADNDHARNECARGLRLLAALEGQPNECWHPKCVNGEQVWWNGDKNPCAPCQGTSHDLSGALPHIEWSPAVRRKSADAFIASDEKDRPADGVFGALLNGLLAQGEFEWYGGRLDVVTRVDPRGAHRGGLSRISARPENETARAVCSLDERISYRGWSSTYLGPTPQSKTMPRWRRGELKHDQQREDRRKPAPNTVPLTLAHTDDPR